MALNEDMQNIIKSIYKPLLIYIPRRLFKNLSLIEREKLKKIEVFFSLFVIDDTGMPISIEDNSPQLALLGKAKMLKTNVFQLLEMKSNLGEDPFLFLLKEYTKEIDTLVYATEIIKNDAKLEAPNYKIEIQWYLNLQHSIFVEHQTELKTHFGNWKSKIELDRIFKRFTLPKLNLNSSIIEKPETVSINNVVKNINRKSSKETTKKVYLSDEDADKYLLKTVFSVKN